MQLGNNIIKYRKSQNLTRKQLSKKAKVVYRTLENIERNKTKDPGINVILKVSKTLGISIDTLVKGEVGKKITVPEEIQNVLSKKETLYMLSLLSEAKVTALKKLVNFLMNISKEMVNN